ncbi:MAG: co-chaperone DjlA [Gammaproteobacteria bacterium]|nr:co-chaperone DjlA [Gammaproteobacteria bacterium]NVK87392.1 co-chaperone DjlA [Gammaproteobacteria bacterium]
MSIWGKLIGGVLGFFTLGPIGMIIGIYIGHNFDKGLHNITPMSAEQQALIQASFFSATFVLMGRLAKADGRVSESEIHHAEQIMAYLRLNNTMRQQAIGYFNLGKGDNDNWRSELEQFAKLTQTRRELRQMMLEMLIQASFADGDIHPTERQVLLEVGRAFNYQPLVIERLIMMVRAQQSFHSGRQQHAHGGAESRADQLAQAYQVLDVKPEASLPEVKKAYRKLMAQHHPDKLVAKGLPPEMIKVATEKTQEIKAAYETIVAARKST